MIQVRRSEDRGHANHGWLDTYHTFSFADYYDPRFMGFGALRVINEDRVAPGGGFGRHGHRDMEILTYVLEGALAHQDSMGHQQSLGPHEIQRMSAGTGILHSEFNASKIEPVHFFQIWIEPAARSIKPAYEQIRFDPKEKENRWKRLAGPANGDGAAIIHQDAQVFVADVGKGVELSYRLAPKRAAWLHAVRGKVAINGVKLRTGDAAAITAETDLLLSGDDGVPSEVLLFDLG
jgi:quercetin 2,3-dioxygenase